MFKTPFITLVALALQFSLTSIKSSAADKKDTAKIKVLLVDGQNNHDWMRCSPVMMETLDATGRFSIERAIVTKFEVEKFNPDFSKYDVVLSNYNGASWKKETKESFVKYIKE